MPVSGTIGLGQLDPFVDHHAIRYIDAVTQLVGGQSQDGQFDRVELLQRAVQVRFDMPVDLGLVARHASEQFMEIRPVDAGEIVVDAKLRLDFVQTLASHVPLIQRLHGQATRHSARRDLALGRLGRLGIGTVVAIQAHLTSRAVSRLTISRADNAASAPLLPALVPERSMACSMESTVSTPKETGPPYSMDTWARPLVHSPA